MEPTSTPVERKSSGLVFAGVATLYLLMCLCLGTFVFVTRQQIPGLQNYFPTETFTPGPTSTPTTTPVVHKPQEGDNVIEDDFSGNTQNWRIEWGDSRLTTDKGKLVFEQPSSDKYAVTTCTPCKFDHNHFYIEADVSTTEEINDEYGLAFNGQDDFNICYIFMINTVKGQYKLYKKGYNQGNIWMLRISNKSRQIRPHPETNKLGIYFNKDYIELYINGVMVDNYQDLGTTFTSGQFGFYVSGGELLGDNLFAYGK